MRKCFGSALHQTKNPRNAWALIYFIAEEEGVCNPNLCVVCQIFVKNECSVSRISTLPLPAGRLYKKIHLVQFVTGSEGTKIHQIPKQRCFILLLTPL